jgi:hypothetical protein
MIMLSKIVSRHSVQVLAVALLVLLLVASLGSANLSFLQAKPAQAAAPAAAPALSLFVCTTVSVAVFNNRIDVECTAAPPDATSVYYFAVPTTDASNAARYLSLFTTARITGKVIGLFYTPGDTSGAAWGCNASDCRAISGARIW